MLWKTFQSWLSTSTNILLKLPASFFQPLDRIQPEAVKVIAITSVIFAILFGYGGMCGLMFMFGSYHPFPVVRYEFPKNEWQDSHTLQFRAFPSGYEELDVDTKEFNGLSYSRQTWLPDVYEVAQNECTKERPTYGSPSPESRYTYVIEQNINTQFASRQMLCIYDMRTGELIYAPTRRDLLNEFFDDSFPFLAIEIFFPLFVLWGMMRISLTTISRSEKVAYLLFVLITGIPWYVLAFFSHWFGSMPPMP
jgi:hypothetical protein